jgi:hypothetical protein
MDLPKNKYDPKSTVHDRLKDWEKLGVWKKVIDAIGSSEYIQGKLSIDKVAIDSADVPAKMRRSDRVRWKSRGPKYTQSLQESRLFQSMLSFDLQTSTILESSSLLWTS